MPTAFRFAVKMPHALTLTFHTTRQGKSMYNALEKISERPEPFQFYTARDLWTDEHTSGRMLSFHLDGVSDLASRNAAFVNRSAEWIAARFNIGRDSRIADFGCGPGLYTTRLARHQARVTGIDFSKRSIAYAMEVARREQMDIHYVNADYQGTLCRCRGQTV